MQQHQSVKLQKIQGFESTLKFHIEQKLIEMDMLGWVEIDDIYQEVCLRTLKYPKTITNYKGFIKTVANNVIYQEMRKLVKVRVQDPEKLTNHFISSYDRNLYRSLEVSELYQTITEILSDRDQKIVFLRYFQNLSWKQVGQELNSSTESVKKQNQRILKKLKTHLS